MTIMDCPTNVETLSNQLAKTQHALFVVEEKLQLCLGQNKACEQCNSDILSIIYDNPLVLLVGVALALPIQFVDQRLASRFAKKHGIKQKAVLKFLFPTFVCFVQICLRSKSKNSKLANLLSVFKRSKTSVKSRNSRKSRSPTNTISHPTALSSLSDDDSVFTSPQHQSNRQRQSFKAKYQKTSTVSINVSSQVVKNKPKRQKPSFVSIPMACKPKSI